jgi:hypothetical protein
MDAGALSTAMLGSSPQDVVGDNETLLRRLLPGRMFRAKATSPIPVEAFMPREPKPDTPLRDVDGISVDRLDYTTLDIACRRPDNGKQVFLLAFGALAVREAEMSVRAAPLPENIAHALIPELTSKNYAEPILAVRMAEMAAALRDASKLVFSPA